MSQHGQVARLQGSPAGAEPSLAELLDPVALEARLVEARARRLEAIARRKAAAISASIGAGMAHTAASGRSARTRAASGGTSNGARAMRPANPANPA